jgi:hypothetical protein
VRSEARTFSRFCYSNQPAKRSVRLAPPQREEQRFHNLGNKPSSPCVRNGSRNIGFGFGSTISVILLALEKQDGFDIR